MVWGHWLDSSGSWQGQVVGSSECSNEPVVYLLRKDSSLWSYLVFCLCWKYCFGHACQLSGSCVSATVRIGHFFLCSQKVLKYADTDVFEFQSSRRNILMKIHANIFVLTSSSVLKCFYHVSQLLLHDPFDWATTVTSWTLCLWTSYLELKLNAYTHMANACYSLLCL